MHLYNYFSISPATHWHLKLLIYDAVAPLHHFFIFSLFVYLYLFCFFWHLPYMVVVALPLAHPCCSVHG